MDLAVKSANNILYFLSYLLLMLVQQGLNWPLFLLLIEWLMYHLLHLLFESRGRSPECHFQTHNFIFSEVEVAFKLLQEVSCYL